MADAPIQIVSYDPDWPALFEAERADLARLLSRWIVGSIEHVGSTAVVGLSAKPVIDIMVGVESLPASAAAKPVLADSGYQYADYKSDVMHWFCKPSFEARTHHLHLVPYDGPLWHERLAFRDRLRNDPAVAKEYEELKLQLAHQHEHDREAYTEAKSPFIARVLGLGSAPANIE